MREDLKLFSSPEARRALERFVNSADPQLTRAGWQLFKQGAVREYWAEGTSLCGEVRGAKLFTARLMLENGAWRGVCNCAVVRDCEHSRALANFWIDLLDKATRPGAVLPAPKPVSTPRPTAVHVPSVRGEQQEMRFASPSSNALKPAPAGSTPAPAAKSTAAASSHAPSSLPPQRSAAPASVPAKPAAPVPQASAVPPKSSSPGPVLQASGFVAVQARKLEAALGSPLSPGDRAWLANLEDMHRHLVKVDHGHLPVRVLRRHGFLPRAMGTQRDYENPFHGWWDPSEPPATPWELWEFIALAMDEAGEALPRFAKPLTDLRAARERVAAMRARQEIDTWRSLLEPKVPAGPAELRLFTCHGIRLRLGDDGWAVQMLSGPGGEWEECDADFWARVRRDIQVNSFAGLPPAQQLLGTLLLAEAGEKHKVDGLSRVLGTMMAFPGNEGCLVGPEGLPFVVQAQALEHRLAPIGGGRLAFALCLPDGRPAEDARLLALSPFPTYSWKARLYRGPKPLPATSAPESILGDPRVVGLLRSRAVSIDPSLKLRFRSIILRPRLRCRAEGGPAGEGGRERAVFVVEAVNPEGGEVLRWCMGSWSWDQRKAPPTRDPDGLLLDHDNSGGLDLARRLREFGVEERDRAQGEWECDITKAFPELFSAWRASLPDAVEVLADSILAGLVGGAVKASVRVDADPSPDFETRDWFDVKVGIQATDTTLTGAELALLLKARGKWVRLPRHGFRRVEIEDRGQAGRDLALLEQLGLGAADVLAGGGEAVHRVHALQLAPAADQLRDEQAARALRERLERPAAPPAEVPAGVHAELRPYQLEGFRFLAHLSSTGLGGVLADDMGLGKTLQTLAWLMLLSDERTAAGKPFRALIVCPKSVTHGWLSEAARFTPGLPATAFLTTMRAEDLPASGLLVCNYAQLRLNAEVLAKQRWDAAVLDEGQFIKNPGSQVAVVCRSLKAAHRLVLTGTPIENRTLDLWSLLAFAQPGLLGPQAGFRRLYAGDDADALARLRRRTRHFMLRRTKGQVATDLPARIEDEIIVDLEPEQQALYDAELKRARQELLKVTKPVELENARFNILASLLRLRQICCHPGLVSAELIHAPSAKLEALVERVEELRDEGHKVLVFSQFTGMLDIIAERLNREGIGHLLLTGQTEDRQVLVKRFQEDPSVPVFLLSIKAAGFGLTLTAADYVFLYDPWWNPAVEAQAIDRAHRIGQTQVVTAYRLLASGSVEQKIRAMQHDKAELAGSVVQEESLVSVMDLESLRGILG